MWTVLSILLVLLALIVGLIIFCVSIGFVAIVSIKIIDKLMDMF